ncbi:hypothetical protein THOM_0035 [Trachipleistophora hominis]|uniref:Uncharacterized protein n=1 Tax=Trachipleistophora hominis TaxID=72359 RepID=L7K0M1_TRAHO|nr:hypothetical protein THOM_0035 [Trachipleistophora hominis]
MTKHIYNKRLDINTRKIENEKRDEIHKSNSELENGKNTNNRREENIIMKYLDDKKSSKEYYKLLITTESLSKI